MAVYQGRYMKLSNRRGKRITNVSKGVVIEIMPTIGKRAAQVRKGIYVHAESSQGGTGITGTAPRQEPLEIAWKRSIFE